MDDAAEQDARGANIVTDVDHENGQIANAPERARQHDEPTCLTEQRRNGRASLRREPGDDLRHQEQEEDDCDEPEKLRQVAQSDVRLEIRCADIRNLGYLFVSTDGGLAFFHANFADEVATTSLLCHLLSVSGSGPACAVSARVDVNERSVPAASRIHACPPDELGVGSLDAVHSLSDDLDVTRIDASITVEIVHRSEERRVGKECRSWWSP